MFNIQFKHVVLKAAHKLLIWCTTMVNIMQSDIPHSITPQCTNWSSKLNNNKLHKLTWHISLHHSIGHHSCTVQDGSTVQYNTVQYSTVQNGSINLWLLYKLSACIPATTGHEWCILPLPSLPLEGSDRSSIHWTNYLYSFMSMTRNERQHNY